METYVSKEEMLLILTTYQLAIERVEQWLWQSYQIELISSFTLVP